MQSNMKNRGCRGRASKRKHREEWLKRIGAAWVVAHQDGAAGEAVQDVKKIMNEKKSRLGCAAPAEKRKEDVHHTGAAVRGEKPRVFAGEGVRKTSEKKLCSPHPEYVDREFGGDTPNMAVLTARDVRDIRETRREDGAKTRRGEDAAVELGTMPSSKFSELRAAMAAMEATVERAATRSEQPKIGAAERENQRIREEKTEKQVQQLAHQEEKKSLVCEDCGREHTSRSQLFIHLRIAHPEIFSEQAEKTSAEAKAVAGGSNQQRDTVVAAVGERGGSLAVMAASDTADCRVRKEVEAEIGRAMARGYNCSVCVHGKVGCGCRQYEAKMAAVVAKRLKAVDGDSMASAAVKIGKAVPEAVWRWSFLKMALLVAVILFCMTRS